MAARHEVETVFTAKDEASKVAAKVADSLEEIEEHAEIDLELNLTRGAEEDLEGIADAIKEAREEAERLGQEDITVRVHAEDIDTATHALGDLGTAVTRVDETTVDIKVNTGDLVGAETAVRKLGNATEKVASTAPSSAGALRDVGGAFGDVGTGALDALEGVLGFSETLGQLNPKLAGAAASIAKFAFGIGSAVFVASALPDILEKITGRAEDLKESLAALSSGDSSFETFNKAANDFANSMDSLDSSAAGGFTAFSQVLSRVFGDEVADAGDRLKIFKETLEKSIPAAQALIDSLEGHIDTEELDDYANRLRQVQLNTAKVTAAGKDAAKTQAVYNRAVAIGIDNIENYPFAELERIVDETDNGTEAQKRQAKQAAAYVAGLERKSDAEARAADASEKHAEAVHEAAAAYADAGNIVGLYNQRIASVAEHAGELADNTFDNVNAASDFEAAIDDVQESLKDNGKGIRTVAKDMGKLPDHFELATDKGRKLADSFEGLARSIGTNLAQAVEDNTGNLAAIGTEADKLRANLAKEMGLNLANPKDLAAFQEIEKLVGLDQESITFLVNAALTDQAKALLAVLDPTLTPEQRQTITLAIAFGNPQAAYDELQKIMASQFAALPVPAQFNIDPVRARKQLEEQLENTMAGEGLGPVDVDLSTATPEEIQTMINTLLAHVKPKDVPVDADTAPFDGAVKTAKDKAKTPVNVPVNLVVNTSSLRAAEQRMEELQLTSVPAAASVTNVTVNMPRGASGRDVVAAQRRHVRRNGGLGVRR